MKQDRQNAQILHRKVNPKQIPEMSQHGKSVNQSLQNRDKITSEMLK